MRVWIIEKWISYGIRYGERVDSGVGWTKVRGPKEDCYYQAKNCFEDLHQARVEIARQHSKRLQKCEKELEKLRSIDPMKLVPREKP